MQQSLQDWPAEVEKQMCLLGLATQSRIIWLEAMVLEEFSISQYWNVGGGMPFISTEKEKKFKEGDMITRGYKIK